MASLSRAHTVMSVRLLIRSARPMAVSWWLKMENLGSESRMAVMLWDGWSAVEDDDVIVMRRRRRRRRRCIV